VRPTSRNGRGHLFVALIIASALSAAPASSDEIFKCVAKDGGPLYQNFPCYLDSPGWLPSSEPVAKAPPMAGVAVQEKPKTVPISVASTVNSTSAREPRIGMTADEVRALLGEPVEMVEDEPASGGRVSNWRYADGRIVQFDNRHRVLKVQR
jgi:hypothetical protein